MDAVDGFTPDFLAACAERILRDDEFGTKGPAGDRHITRLDAAWALATAYARDAADAERWQTVLRCLGGSTIEHQDGRTYFAVVVPFHMKDRDDADTTRARFIKGIDLAKRPSDGESTGP